MQEDDRLAGAARAGGVVVQPSTVEIDELTAHDVVGASEAGYRTRGRLMRQDVPAAAFATSADKSSAG